MAIAFDAATHTYRVNGRLTPNVTRILEPLYDFSGIPRDVLERKKQIGEAVHRAIEFDLLNDLDDSTIDPQIAGYIAAWRLYRVEREYKHALSECRVAHLAFGYAGTLDLYGEARLKRASKRGLVVIDLKTTFDIHPAVALQTAAYRAALAFENKSAAKAARMALQLKPDGTYHEEWFEDESDFAIFLSFLQAHNWRATHL